MTLKDLPTLLAYAFATSSIPMYFVENIYLRRYNELISDNTDYEMPHRWALTSKVKAEAKKAEEAVKTLVSVSRRKALF